MATHPETALFLYHLQLSERYSDLSNWTEKSHTTIVAHADFLDDLGKKGILGFAGRTQYLPGHHDLFGIAVIRAKSLEEAKELLSEDPAVKAGIQIAKVHPYSIAINHLHNLSDTPENEISGDNLEEIARQLRRPEGEFGEQIGQLLDKNNRSMTLKTIDSLNLTDGDIVLELGHGICGHLSLLMERGPGLHYTGVEISELMHNKAREINASWVNRGLASFGLYDGNLLPYPDDSFDKILTVNTLYFWEQPQTLIRELSRVLKAGGLCSIAFGDKEYLESLPVTQFGFEIYDSAKIDELLRHSDFTQKEISSFAEPYTDEISGKPGKHSYSILSLSK